MGKGLDAYIEDENQRDKTASQGSDSNNSLGDLLNQLNAEDEDLNKEAAAGNANADDKVENAEAPITGAAPAVVSATEDAQNKRLEMAGADLSEIAAGEAEKTTKPTDKIEISAGDGNVTDEANMSKEPGSVAKAEIGTVKIAELTVDQFATQFTDAFMAKVAERQLQEDYNDAVVLLKTAGALEGWNIPGSDELMKTAGLADDDATPMLDKLAAKKEGDSISPEQLIQAASELRKVAALEDAEGDDDAEGEVEKTASQAVAATPDAIAAAVESVILKHESEKTAALLAEDTDVQNAIAVLKEKGVINTDGELQ